MAKAPLKKVKHNYYFTKDYSIAVRAISKREALYRISMALGRLVMWNEVKKGTFHNAIEHLDNLSFAR